MYSHKMMRMGLRNDFGTACAVTGAVDEKLPNKVKSQIFLVQNSKFVINHKTWGHIGC